jgi:predicted nucleic acid-binding protein
LKIIVDTNIFFSSLLKKTNKFLDRIIKSKNNEFVSCRLVILELFKHKEKLLKNSNLSDDEIYDLYYLLLRKVEFYNEMQLLKEHLLEAESLCKDIDLKDTPFIALTLELDGKLWTGDKILKEGLKAKGFDRFFEPD